MKIRAMQTIPANIVKFLSNHHVISIAAAEEGEVWAACCFYVFDEANARLIVLTSLKTKHGGMMSRSAKVAGTIAGQPDSIAKISGIQFAATAALIEDEADLKVAQSLYYKAHPVARVMKSDVWALNLDSVKFTDNKLVFAQTTYWNRED